VLFRGPALAIGIAAIAGIVVIAFVAYQNSQNSIRVTVADGNLVLGKTISAVALGDMGRTDQTDQVDSESALDRLSQTWARTNASHKNAYLCVVGSSGKLDLHSLKPEMKGTDVSNVVLSPQSGQTVMQLLRNKDSWSGQNTNYRGIRQLVGYHYEPSIDSLVAVHVPARIVDARFHAAVEPWIWGIALIGGVLLPCSLGLLFYNLRRANTSALRNLEALHTSESLNRRLVENSPFCIHEIELDGTLRSMNPAGLAMMGVSSEADVCGVEYLSSVNKPDRDRVRKLLEQARLGQTSHFDFETVNQQAFASCFVPLEDSTGAVQRIMGITQDITEKRRADQLSRSELKIFEAIASGESLDRTLALVISSIESQSPDIIASILLLDDDNVHLRHAAALSLPEGYTSALDGVAISEGIGSCGTSVFRSEPVFVDDIATDPLWENYRELAARHQLASCWSTPIIDSSGTTIGTFAIYRRETGPANAYHRQLIEIFTHLAAVTVSRHQGDVALRKSEARFRTIFKQAAVGVAQLNSITGRFMQVNDRYCEISGMSAEWMLSKTWMDINHPDDVANDIANMERLRSGEIQEFAMEKRLQRRDGTFIWVSLTVSPMWQSGENPTTHIAVVEDITARKVAEEALSESERRYRYFVEQTREGFSRIDFIPPILLGIPQHEFIQQMYEYGVVAECNETYAQIYGYDTSAEVIGKRVMDIQGGMELKENFKAIKSFIGEDYRVFDLETTERDRNGRTIYLSNNAVGITEGDHLLSLWSTQRDVTERKLAADALRKSEEKLRNLNVSLELHVAERTMELQRVNEDLEAYAHSVAHDLRAPLRAMYGFSKALREDCADRLDETGREYTDFIESGARQMDKLITDLLEYSSVGHSELPEDAVELDAVVKEAMNRLAAEISDRQATVKVISPLGTTLGHRGTLVQIFANLISNGTKFVADGMRPEIRIWSESRNGWLRLWVEDNGIGIDPEFRRKIFQVFERLHSSEDFAGTGIGLAIVRRAVESLGGRYGVESEPGKGSQFWVEFRNCERKE
jgi:PAS domain S-box-containing protein